MIPVSATARQQVATRLLALATGLALFAGACTGDSSDPIDQSGPSSSSGSESNGVETTVLDQTAPVSLVTRSDLPPELASVPLEVWQGAGASVSAPETVIDVADFGAIADDGVSDSAAINAAVGEARQAEVGAVILLPEGTLLLTETINLYSNMVLRGQGASTRLELDLRGQSGIGISAVGSADDQDWHALDGGAAQGATTIQAVIDNAQPGDAIEIEQDNDADLMVTKPEWDVDWGLASEGEIVVLASANAGELQLTRPLVSAYLAERAAKIRLVRAAQNIGVEDLSIVRLDEGYGHSIRFRYATNVWVTNVISSNTSRAHVAMEQVADCTISEGIIHGATDYGDGGRAYGISLARHTTACLVFNNTLYELRHAIIIQLGASGNVIAYNHARGSAGYEDRRPRADLSLHGHWPQQNLFEGNIFDRVEIADWWGPAGPGNTFLRNCVLDHVIILDSSDDQQFLLNVIEGEGISLDPTVARIGLVGNTGSVEGPASVTTLQSSQFTSLWTATSPSIFEGQWPPIQPSQGASSCDLPASGRSPLGNR